ncbi:MAG: alpha/beta fold hydrolase [Candidatus Binatia bacterium]
MEVRPHAGHHGGGRPFNLDYAMAMWRRIAAPTLLVHGAESGEFWRGRPGDVYLDPDDLAHRLGSFRQHAFVEIPGAGHMVHFDRPRELLAAIRAFLIPSVPPATRAA